MKKQGPTARCRWAVARIIDQQRDRIECGAGVEQIEPGEGGHPVERRSLYVGAGDAHQGGRGGGFRAGVRPARTACSAGRRVRSGRFRGRRGGWRIVAPGAEVKDQRLRGKWCSMRPYGAPLRTLGVAQKSNASQNGVGESSNLMFVARSSGDTRFPQR